MINLMVNIQDEQLSTTVEQELLEVLRRHNINQHRVEYIDEGATTTLSELTYNDNHYANIGDFIRLECPSCGNVSYFRPENQYCGDCGYTYNS